MKKNYILSVIGVLLVVGIGISFAYFVSGVLFSGEGSNVTLEPGDMIKVTYDAGSGSLNTEGMIPGDSTSKDFTVTVTPTETEKEATYVIILNITENTFVKCDDSNYDSIMNACSKDADELVYRLKGNDNQVISEGSLIGITGEIKLALETKTVEVETTYNYTLEIEFVETGYDQNHNQNKVLKGEVNVEFSGKLLREEILANSDTILTRSDFSTVITNTTTGVIYKSLNETQYDNDGEVYYFAGNPTDNWVSFAGFYWRIIRINGNGSIRLIYSGNRESGPVTTGEDTQIGTSAFNELYDDNAYVGYMYGTPGSDTYEETHANINDSTIKEVVDKWFSNNLFNYINYIDGNAGFCGDREITSVENSIYGKLGYGKNVTSYGYFDRFYDYYVQPLSDPKPTLICANKNDLFTSYNSKSGNQALLYPVGLITADEIIFAGGLHFRNNTNADYLNHFLQTNLRYFTMTPGTVGYGTELAPRVVDVRQYGDIVDDNSITNTFGVRPVINLRADVTVIGSGTQDDPYVVET